MLRLTRDQARRMILGRHGLVEPENDPLVMAQRLVCVQTQYSASLPTALACRGADLPYAWDTQVLDSGAMLKCWSIRGTLHAHTLDNYVLMLEAMGARRQMRHRRFMTQSTGLSDPEIERLEEGLLKALESGPKNRQQLHDAVPEFKSMEWTGWGLDVGGLAAQGKLVVHTPERGPTYFRRTAPPTFCRDEFEARCELMRRYFAVYAPATLGDFAYWTGLEQAVCRDLLKHVGGELVECEVDGLKGTRYLPLPDVEALDTPEAEGVRLLAKFDVIVLGHKDKSLFFTEAQQKMVFRKAGQVEAVILENGLATGTWRLDRSGKKGTILVEPFGRKKPLQKPRLVKPHLKRFSKALGLEISLPSA